MLMQNISADRCGEEVGGLKMNARNILAKKREFMIVLSAIALIACPLYGCGSSTGAHAGITRLDDEGYLYYMDYTKDYYGKDVMDAMRKGKHYAGIPLRLWTRLSPLCDDPGAVGTLQRYFKRGVLYRNAGIGGIGDSPERCAEPAYERIRYFDDTVQRDLQ